MAQKILITYQDFIDYIETLARQHVDILHGQNGKDGFTEMNKSYMTASSRTSNLTAKHVLWGAPEISDASTSPDNTLDAWFGDVYVMDRADGTLDKYSKISECIDVLQDFRARMKHDAKISTLNWIKRLDFDSIRIFPIEIAARKMVGARMEFRFLVASNHVKNENKWLQ